MPDRLQFGEMPKPLEITPDVKALGRVEYEKKRNQLVWMAILKHLEAVSYRAFRVGSSVLAEDLSNPGKYITAEDHNFKPWEKRQNSWDKLCAENNVCSDVIVQGADYVHAIIVASHHKEIGKAEEDKSHTSKALHSCRNCRNLFRELIQKGIMSNETIIRFVDDGPLIYEDKDDTEEYIIDDGEKSYTINKDKIFLCLYDENGDYYPLNHMVYVLLHEISHMLNKVDVGHTEAFYQIFDELLAKANKLGVYNFSIPTIDNYCL